MSKRRKRLERLRRNPNNLSLDELQRVLEDYGFEYKRTVGSHYTFSYVLGGEIKLFVVPFHRPLKPLYVKRALQIIDKMIETRGEDDSDGSE
jgi:predicted RNA binding protein YcfA (HicA-like mRNA interferase family)